MPKGLEETAEGGFLLKRPSGILAEGGQGLDIKGAGGELDQMWKVIRFPLGVGGDSGGQLSLS